MRASISSTPIRHSTPIGTTTSCSESGAEPIRLHKLRRLGHVTPNQIRDLIGVMTTEKAQLGFFVTLEPPTKPMKDAALAAGYYQPPSGAGRRVEALQIRTIEELLTGNTFDFPLYGSNVSYLQADRVQDDGKQGELML